MLCTFQATLVQVGLGLGLNAYLLHLQSVSINVVICEYMYYIRIKSTHNFRNTNADAGKVC